MCVCMYVCMYCSSLGNLAMESQGRRCVYVCVSVYACVYVCMYCSSLSNLAVSLRDEGVCVCVCVCVCVWCVCISVYITIY